MISSKKALQLLKSAGKQKFNPGPLKKPADSEAREYSTWAARIRRRTSE